MLLQDVKVIDKRFSEFDEDKSDPGKGRYKWTRKAYIDPRFFDKNREWFFTWWKYDPRDGFEQVEKARAGYGYEPVTVDEPFVPEGAVVTAENWWRFGDVVLMKCSLIEHLKRRERDMAIAKKAGKSGIKEMQAELKDADAALPDDYIDELCGEVVDPTEAKQRSLKRIL